MKTAIVYISKYGTTQKVANKIKEYLSADEVVLNDLSLNSAIPLEQYDRIILGSSIYAGKVNKKFSTFCLEKESLLKGKEIGLFICGMIPQPSEQQKELHESFSTTLLEHAKAKAFLGGEFLMDKMNLVDRMIIKMVAKQSVNHSDINKEGIRSFVEELNT